ncbi:uroporphyrinogen-III synthase [Acetobacter sp.]|uniref:uroporphyrinogen-III synthase n=1 Tax=Acetobacter sp. TaxID=440 RepID=UPI0039E8CBC2
MNRDTPQRRGVLVVRPEPGLTETRALLEQQGWQTWGMESLCVTPRSLAPQTGMAAVLITSSQAIPALSEAVDHTIPVYAVGDATASRVRAAGFRTVISASGNATQLAEVVLTHLSPNKGSLLLLSGEKQGVDLAKTLRHAGFRIRRRLAYSTSAATQLPSPTLQAFQEKAIGVSMVFSAASARAFCAALTQTGIATEGLRAISISENTAKELRKAGFSEVVTAKTPNTNAMIESLKQAFHQHATL